MAWCRSCQVTIKDDTKICPLCGGVLESDGTDPKPSMYPTLVLKEKVMVRVTQSACIIGALLEVFLIMINLTINPEFLWCVITGTSFLYVILVLYTTTIPNLALRSRFLILSMALILIGLSVDWVTGFRGWALSVELPIQILFMNIVIFVLYLIQIRDFQQYIWMCFLNLFLCGIGYIAFLFGYRIFSGLLIAATIVTVTEMLLIMVRGGKRTPAELKRRFHA